MRTTKVRIQLAVFGVISALSIGYLMLGYADGARTTGISTYEIHADFRDTSGLYPRALVTYRGVQVGRVAALDLSGRGVDVTLVIDAGVRVPVGARAEIHSNSAVGEQYVDLVPDRGGSTFLSAGATIPRSDTREMPQMAPVLDKLNGLLDSIPKEETARVLEEADTAFGASAGDVQHLIDDSTELVDEATKQVESTKQLLTSVQPVLETQKDVGSETRSYLASLADISDEVADNDQHLSSLLNRGPSALDTVEGLISGLTPSFSILMANLVSLGEVFNVYVPNLEQTFVMYPAFIDRLGSAGLRHKAEGMANLDIRLNPNDPPSCTQGYIPVSLRRSPADTTPTVTPPKLHCTLSSSAREGVRGARNMPCPNDESKRAADSEGCGLRFRGEQNRPYARR